MKTNRVSEHKINDIILHRWSARAMGGEELKEEEVMPLFEAAKWAPSAMNNQLTRFVYARKNTSYWSSFFNLLADGNKEWCKNAALLVIVISRKNAHYKDRLQKTHSFEAGAAFENLAIEGISRGLVVHPMSGFDFEKAASLLNLTDKWNVECMVAIGKPGDVDVLSKTDQTREFPSDRKPLKEIIFEGEFIAD